MVAGPHRPHAAFVVAGRPAADVRAQRGTGPATPGKIVVVVQVERQELTPLARQQVVLQVAIEVLIPAGRRPGRHPDEIAHLHDGVPQLGLDLVGEPADGIGQLLEIGLGSEVREVTHEIDATRCSVPLPHRRREVSRPLGFIRTDSLRWGPRHQLIREVFAGVVRDAHIRIHTRLVPDRGVSEVQGIGSAAQAVFVPVSVANFIAERHEGAVAALFVGRGPPAHPARHEKGGAALTLAGRNAIGAGFALPGDAGRRPAQFSRWGSAVARHPGVGGLRAFAFSQQTAGVPGRTQKKPAGGRVSRGATTAAPRGVPVDGDRGQAIVSSRR